MQRRHGPSFRWWQLLLLALGAVGVFFIWDGLRQPDLNNATPIPQSRANPPDKLTSADVLPTLTLAPQAVARAIVFPSAGGLTADIVRSVWRENTWETRYLGDSVGHLDGTAWLDDPGGNIVLAGHVEDAQGSPGPFAYLFRAHLGDVILLRNGTKLVTFKVVKISRVAPDDLSVIAQDGRSRLTLITCTDWDTKLREYHSRLIVVADPIKVG